VLAVPHPSMLEHRLAIQLEDVRRRLRVGCSEESGCESTGLWSRARVVALTEHWVDRTHAAHGQHTPVSICPWRALLRPALLVDLPTYMYHAQRGAHNIFCTRCPCTLVLRCSRGARPSNG